VDDKPSQDRDETTVGGVTADMRVGAREKLGLSAPRKAPRRKWRLRPGSLLAGVAAVVGVAALATTAWTYTEMRREVLRISTEMAQVRLSLDLYAQRSSPQASAAVAAPTGSDTSLAAIENRLAVLEQNWRAGNGAAAGTQPAALPSISGPTVSAESDGDCLPSGMRLLVASGDSYPVCGTDATITVMNVNNGYISLTDGTTVPSGGNVPLNGTACMLAVTSGGNEAETGFAEIRVTC